MNFIPGGPIFYDKLFNVQPYTRAKDIELKKKQLREKIKSMSGFVTSDGKIEIERVAIDILDSLKPVMEELNLTENSLPNSLLKIIEQKLNGMQDQKVEIDIIHRIQEDIFDKICAKEKIFKLYESRLVNTILTFNHLKLMVYFWSLI